ncbi:MAG: TlpA family protein disulfide reductase [Pseudobacteriovorax sp.]|nr:TlpA family protein disulfide reductase [Pseudobacteriovorax sp.]
MTTLGRVFLLLGLLLASQVAVGQKPSSPGPLIKSITDKYVHSWKKFPSIKGNRLGSDDLQVIEPERGFVNVAVFLASWCIPCQQQMSHFQDLEKKYADRYTRFIYIFAHDMEEDALAFVKEYKVSGTIILANVALMEAFHQPDLPTVYLGDRHGWLTWRHLAIDEKGLATLDDLLNSITIF